MKTYTELASPMELAARDALMRVLDPEIGESIVDLGLVYGVEAEGTSVKVVMTMTSPACPMGELLLDEVHAELAHAFPDAEIELQLVWEPPWSPDMISAEAKERLGWE